MGNPHVPSDTAAAQAFRSVALPDICRVEDLASHLQLAPSTIRRALREGRLPGRRLGRRWLVSRSALLEWLRTDLPGGASRRPSNLRMVRGEEGPS